MIRLSVPRRMVLDLLYFARGIPTVPVQKHMALGPLMAARAACKERPRWTASAGDVLVVPEVAPAVAARPREPVELDRRHR
jgi:hypothetical protein